MKTSHFLLIALIALIALVMVPAAVAVLGFSMTAPAQDAKPFELTGTVSEVKVLAEGPDAVVYRVAVVGEGTIGKYREDATVTFVRTGATWLFEARATVTVLDAKGERTADVVELLSSGSSPPGASQRGPFRVVGGTGRFDGANGSGAFERDGGVVTYKGLLR